MIAFESSFGDGPLIALAVHDGHEMRPELTALSCIDDADRLREEDPFTGAWAKRFDTFIVSRRSRFEVDLNRPPERSTYRTPAEAWGMRVWKKELPPEVIARSLAIHGAFYRQLRGYVEAKLESHPVVAVLDIHSYNHRRRGPDQEPDDPRHNPEINLGTGTLDPTFEHHAAIFRETMKTEMPPLEALDVRENIKFMGGYVSRYINAAFPGRAFALAVEVKKIFMDEWTGEVQRERHDAVGRLIAKSATALLAAIEADA